MKKLFIMAAVAAAAIVTSCTGGNVQANLTDDVDTLAYELGMAQVDGLKQYMYGQLGVDSAYIDEFIKGMQEGAKGADPKQDAYLKGMQVGKDIEGMAKGLSKEVYGDDSTKTVNVNNILAGLVEGLKGKATMSSDSAMMSFNKRLEPIREKGLLDKYGDNKKAGENFIAAKAKEEGVQKTAGGVYYKVLTEGKGAVPADTATIQVNYEGKLIDGTKFDSSYDRNQPMNVNLAQGGLIQGFMEALKLMPAGSVWEVYIPQELAYGAKEAGQIKPFSALIFKLEIVK